MTTTVEIGDVVKNINLLQATLEKFKPFLGKLKPEERFAGLEGKELLIEVTKAKC